MFLPHIIFTMKRLILTGVMNAMALCAFAQKGIETAGSFTSIRNNDFTQLTSISTPGVSVNYNSDKAVINGSFTIGAIHEDTAHPMWIQLQPSIGTTTSLFTLGQDLPQPDFALSASLSYIVKNKYFYDGTFTDNYDLIQSDIDLNSIDTRSGFHYTASLRDNIKSKAPKLEPNRRLYTAKRINWFNIVPEVGGSKYTFFDRNRVFDSQIYKPYYHLLGINLSFNHYWYLNNEDVHWNGFPTTRFFYYKLAVKYGSNNNTEIIKKADIEEISTVIIDPITNTTRQVIKNTSAYSGIYEDYNAVTPSFEILYSFAKSFALDFFGNYNFITSNNATTTNNGSIASGLYFYTNSNDSKINIGVYYQRTIGSNSAKEIIGLKTKVPIKW